MNLVDAQGKEMKPVNGHKPMFNFQFAVIIPDRGDRPELLKFCKRQIENQTLKPTKIYHVNFHPETVNKFDLVERVRKGVEMAKADNIDWVIVCENDDQYNVAYLSNMFEAILVNPQISFIGCSKSLYYNLKNNTYQIYDHPKRSSLFQTAFKISALKENSVLNGFRWPDNDDQFLDISLWSYADKNCMSLLHDQPLAIGMKHGVGLCGGKGHRTRLANDDIGRHVLKSLVDDESFAFYMDLKV